MEGFEYQVLKGLKNFLIRHRPPLIMEISDSARIELGDMGTLQGALPPEYMLRSIRQIPPRYRVEDFRFDGFDGMILAIPKGLGCRLGNM